MREVLGPTEVPLSLILLYRGLPGPQTLKAWHGVSSMDSA